MEIKPETVRFVVCATSDLLEDASFDVEAWLYRKISEGMRATINAAVLLGDGIGKPLGLLNPNAGIPICDVSPVTAPGQFSWQDLLMLKYEIPMQWMDGCSYLMNQRTFALLQNDVVGRRSSVVWSDRNEHAGHRLSVRRLPD
jgi:HK97 family phage major capsid protein